MSRTEKTERVPGELYLGYSDRRDARRDMTQDLLIGDFPDTDPPAPEVSGFNMHNMRGDGRERMPKVDIHQLLDGGQISKNSYGVWHLQGRGPISPYVQH